MIIGDSIGPFKIERELGSGAMGTVYRALYEKAHGPKKVVAIKIISFGLTTNDSAMARFTRESKILEQLRHPNIVRLIGTGRFRKTPYIAMEFIDGEPLDRMLERRRRLGWEEVVDYMKQLCGALQCAHDAGIIHRDLKPSNLMITHDGTLKLTDFGIAKDQDVTALTGQNSTIGTAAYMSPEQCKGDKNLTGKSDLYSLGIVMYELITGRKPFTAETSVDMFLKHVNDKPVRPTRLVQDLPVWLETLILHLLEKEKEKRPLDAEHVGKALEEIQQKVAAQESAGAAVANARRVDRGLSDTELDDTDREAAKALRDSNPRRRKKKKKDEPGGLPRGLRFVPPVVGLLAIAAVLYFTFRPESEKKLFDKVNAASKEEKIGLAAKYLERFGSDGGEHVDAVKTMLKEARGQKLEGVLTARATGKIKLGAQDNEDAECYANALRALEAEREGELTKAERMWRELQARTPGEKDEYRDGWAWMAEQHLADYRKADEQVKQVQKTISDAQIYETTLKPDPNDAKSLTATAIRHGSLGGLAAVGLDAKAMPYLIDEARAAKAWQELAGLTKEKLELRAWFLLATRERKKYPKDDLKTVSAAALAAQLIMIQTEWKKVEAISNAEPARRDCRNRCRDIVDLYADDSDAAVKRTVKEAEAFLNEMKAKKPAP